jgi:hypothetical protein
LIDVQPLREKIIASIAAGPAAEELDRRQLAHLIAEARHVEVIPSYQCTDDWDLEAANMELMLAASQANVSTNTVYLGRQTYGLSLLEVLRAPSRAGEMYIARRDEYCDQEIQNARSGGRPGDVFVLLSNKPSLEEMARSVACSPLAWARYCERPKARPQS